MEIFKLVSIMIIVVMSLEFCILNLKKKLNDKHPDIFFFYFKANVQRFTLIAFLIKISHDDILHYLILQHIQFSKKTLLNKVLKSRPKYFFLRIFKECHFQDIYVNKIIILLLYLLLTCAGSSSFHIFSSALKDSTLAPFLAFIRTK